LTAFKKSDVIEMPTEMKRMKFNLSIIRLMQKDAPFASLGYRNEMGTSSKLILNKFADYCSNFLKMMLRSTAKSMM